MQRIHSGVHCTLRCVDPPFQMVQAVNRLAFSLSLSLLEFNRRPGLLFWLSLFPSMSIEIRVLKEAYGMVYSCNAHGTILGIQGSHVTP